MLDHVKEDEYQQLCTTVDTLVASTGLDLVIGYVGELNQSWNGTKIADNRRWTVWINNAVTPSGHAARFSFFPTHQMSTLVENLTVERLRNILRHTHPKAVCDLHQNTTVTFEQSADLISSILNARAQS